MAGSFSRLYVLFICVILVPLLHISVIAQDNPIENNTDWMVQSLVDEAGYDLVGVPRGCFVMGADDRDVDVTPPTEICLEPFVMHRTEVTNEQFMSGGRFTEPDQPRDSVTWFEAGEFCASQSYEGIPMRLPTEAEWEYAARGPSNYLYPNEMFPVDGTIAEGVAAYVENSSNRTQTVGAFANGASWVGAVDMAGNVWEWTSSAYFPYPYNPDDGRENQSDVTVARVLRGGSANNTLEDLTTVNRFGRDPATAYSMVGFRCVASVAELPTRDEVPIAMGSDPDVRIIDGVEMAYIPAAGRCIIMGTNDERAEPVETPQGEVCLDNDFLIDVYEVTFAQASGYQFANQSRFNAPELPVNTVTWFEAQEYCESRGGRLPTEAEWSMAARGTRSTLYPWGNEFGFDQADNYISSRNSTGQPLAVGSRAETDISIFGAIDVVGNISEWTASLAASFPYNPDDGRENMDDTTPRVVRGINWSSSGIPRLTIREFLAPDQARETIGFRCVITEDDTDADTTICTENNRNVTVYLFINELQAIDTLEDAPAADTIATTYWLESGRGFGARPGLTEATFNIDDRVTDFETLTIFPYISCDDSLSVTIIVEAINQDGSNISLGDSIRRPYDNINSIDPTTLPISETVNLSGTTDDGQRYEYNIRFTIDIQSTQ